MVNEPVAFLLRREAVRDGKLARLLEGHVDGAGRGVVPLDDLPPGVVLADLDVPGGVVDEGDQVAAALQLDALLVRHGSMVPDQAGVRQPSQHKPRANERVSTRRYGPISAARRMPLNPSVSRTIRHTPIRDATGVIRQLL